MIPSRRLICPLCQFVSWPISLRVQNCTPSWQQARTIAQAQRKRPARMTLSANVSKPRTPAASSDGDRPKRRGTSPFGGMNRTAVPVHVEMEKTRPIPKQDKQRRPPIVSKSARKKYGQPRKSGDMKHMNMQRALSSVSYATRAPLKSRLAEIDSFDQFPFLPIVQQSIPEQALKGMTDIAPTPIQRLAIPALFGLRDEKGRPISKAGKKKDKMEQFLLAAETGSGKTLAYLLPTIDAIKRAESQEADVALEEQPETTMKEKRNQYELEPPPLSVGREHTSARPKAIVLLPTSELVEQVGGLFKAFSHTVKLRVAVISASYSATVIRNRLFSNNGVDVVVSTPHLLGSIAESDPNILSRVTHLIIDEADSLLDRSFSPLTSSIIDRATPSLKQLILCSATIPRSLDSYLRQRYPDTLRLATPNLHAVPRRVQLGVVDIEKDPYRGNRDLACADSIWSIGRQGAEHSMESGEHVQETSPVKRILVFVNEREKAQELAGYLVSKGVDASALSRDTTEQRRSEVLTAFTSTDPSAVSQGKEARIPTRKPGSRGATRILPNTKVLVMTDLGSRGLDTVAVRHVILYDVPHTSIDFIHRLGRTGRMGRRGRGIVLVGKNDRKDVVREVREGMFMGKALI